MEFLILDHCALCLFCLLCLCRAKTGERELTVIDLLVKTSFKEFSRYILTFLCLVRFSPVLDFFFYLITMAGPGGLSDNFYI